jgi:hypothetical protein
MGSESWDRSGDSTDAASRWGRRRRSERATTIRGGSQTPPPASRTDNPSRTATALNATGHLFGRERAGGCEEWKGPDESKDQTVSDNGGNPCMEVLYEDSLPSS